MSKKRIFKNEKKVREADELNLYLDNSTFDELEMLTKGKGGTKSVRSFSTNSQLKHKTGLSLPKHLQNNQHYTFGRNESEMQRRAEQARINDLVNHSFMKDYLEEKVKSRALANIRVKEF